MVKPRTVLVTGAAGGIGQATAAAFAREGASLFLVDREQAETEPLLAAGAADVSACRCDVTDEAAIAAAVEDCVGRSGGLDVIVNVAGAMIYRPIAELTASDWRNLLNVNLVGAALFVGQGLRRMKSGGAIINVASIHAHLTSPLVAPYAAAKAALCSLTRSAAIEGRELGIRVNTILPGAIDTPMLRASPNIASGAEVIDPRDVGQPADVAAVAVFLASDAARFITGAEIIADGGRIVRL